MPRSTMRRYQNLSDQDLLDDIDHLIMEDNEVKQRIPEYKIELERLQKLSKKINKKLPEMLYEADRRGILLDLDAEDEVGNEVYRYRTRR